MKKKEKKSIGTERHKGRKSFSGLSIKKSALPPYSRKKLTWNWREEKTVSRKKKKPRFFR